MSESLPRWTTAVDAHTSLGAIRLGHAAEQPVSDVSLLSPPYRSVRPLPLLRDSSELPNGSVLIAVAHANVTPTLAALTLASRQWPWAIPLLVLRPPAVGCDAAVRVVSELRSRLVILPIASAAGDPSEAAMGAALCKRVPPSAATLADWVARRLDADEIQWALRAQFREALDGTPSTTVASVSAFSRYFVRYGALTAHDWRALARLCIHATSMQRGAPLVPAFITVRAAGEHAVRYLGMKYHEMLSYYGWEWILERALRRARYV